MNTVSFHCPGCATAIHLSHARAGARLECPICFTRALILALDPPMLVRADENRPLDETHEDTLIVLPQEAVRYLCMPLPSGISDDETALAKYLEALLNKQVEEGWLLYRLDTMYKHTRTGLWGRLLGPRTTPVSVAIFRRKS